MKLYLVRHGEALPKHLDPERRLSPAGREAATRFGSFARHVGIQVAAIYHSRKARARQTAEIIASQMVSQRGIIGKDGLLPDDPVEPLAKEIEASEEDLMIIGHLPFVARLTALLLIGDPERSILEFAAGGVVGLEREGSGAWRLRWLIIPELLR